MESCAFHFTSHPFPIPKPHLCIVRDVVALQVALRLVPHDCAERIWLEGTDHGLVEDRVVLLRVTLRGIGLALRDAGAGEPVQ